MFRLNIVKCAVVTAALTLAVSACAPAANPGSGTGAGTASAAAPNPSSSFDKTLKIGTYAAEPPSAYTKSGTSELVGYDIEVGTAIANKMGYNAEFIHVDFQGLIPALTSGRIDMIQAAMSDTPERQKQVTFVDYFRGGATMMVQGGNPKNIHSELDLCGKSVGVDVGTIYVDFANEASTACKAAGKEAINVMSFNDAVTTLGAVGAGRTDAAYRSTDNAAYQLEQTGTQFEIVKEIFKPSGLYGIAISKDNQSRIKEVQAALDALIQDGTYQEILKKWDVESAIIDKALVNGGS